MGIHQTDNGFASTLILDIQSPKLGLDSSREIITGPCVRCRDMDEGTEASFWSTKRHDSQRASCNRACRRRTLECNDVISAHRNICLRTGFLHVGQADFELLISGDKPASASQSAGITECHSVAQAGCSGMILAHYNPCLLGSRAGITGIYHHAWLTVPFSIEMGFHHVGQAGLKLLTSGDPPASASQSVGITETGFCHVAQVGLELLTSGDPPASASQSARITGVSHRI
ncbi:hypothetical protein AAY473_008247 [Plecturocebus cupreus]